MAAGEVEHAAYRFMVSLGRGDEWDPEEFDSVARVIHAFKFGIFLTVLESKYTRSVKGLGNYSTNYVCRASRQHDFVSINYK